MGIRRGTDWLQIADTKHDDANPGKVIFKLSAPIADEFLASVSLDRQTDGTRSVYVTHNDNLGVTLTSTTGSQLIFDRDEWDAFVAGVRAGEFTEEAMLASA